jgi:hypothetical protein
MKKAYFIIPVLVFVFASSVLFGTLRKVRVEKETPAKQVLSSQNEAKKEVIYTIYLENEEVKEILPYEENLTVLKALEQVTQKNSISIDTQKYDFGIIVNKIGNLGGNKTKGWVFYQNSKMGDKGADTTILNPDDRVEWKYQSF